MISSGTEYVVVVDDGVTWDAACRPSPPPPSALLASELDPSVVPPSLPQPWIVSIEHRTASVDASIPSASLVSSNPLSHPPHHPTSPPLVAHLHDEPRKADRRGPCKAPQEADLYVVARFRSSTLLIPAQSLLETSRPLPTSKPLPRRRSMRPPHRRPSLVSPPKPSARTPRRPTP